MGFGIDPSDRWYDEFSTAQGKIDLAVDSIGDILHFLPDDTFYMDESGHKHNLRTELQNIVKGLEED